MIKVAIYIWEEEYYKDRPNLVLSLKEFEEKFNNNELEKYRYIKFIVC